MFVRLDLAKCEPLIALAAEGDAEAWKALLELLWPFCLAILRSSPALRRRGRDEDDILDVCTNVAHKLGRGNGTGLKRYQTWQLVHPDKTFEDWVRIVVANAAKDHAARPIEPVEKELSVKRLLNEFAQSPRWEEMGVRPPMTAAQTAREMLEFARGVLSDVDFQVLALWLVDASFEEIARQAKLEDAEAARKLVRAIVAVLRRHFGPKSSK